MNKIILKPWMYNLVPIFIWALLLMLPFISVPPNSSAAEHHRFLIHILISNLLLLGIFYFHTYVLYRLLKQKKLLWYTAGILLAFMLFGAYEYFFRLPPRQFPLNNSPINEGPVRPGGPGNIMHLLGPMIALLCSYCYRVITDNVAREQLLKDRETVHLRTELSFLRSQINPHFLFNTLNNLTSLARKKSDLLEPAIINLSQLMRYMLYESDDNKVPLKKEIEYLKSYINLQLLRFGDEVSVKTQFSGEFEGCEIDPMLLIPLVENAFKYGTDRDDNNLILINLNVSSAHNQLYFKVVNYFLSGSSAAESTGIGLKNLQRRLDILYPGKHQFTTFGVGDMYTSELTIKLQ